MSNELKPCPFCGGVAELVGSEVGFQVYCSDCDGGIMSDDWVKRAAIEVWNNRCESKQLAVAKAEIAELKSAIQELIDDVDVGVLIIHHMGVNGFDKLMRLTERREVKQ